MPDLNYKCQDIRLNLIEPLYTETTTKKGLLTKCKLIRQGRLLELPLVIQKDMTQDIYWLVAGYPEFEAYKECSVDIVPVRVQPLSDVIEQRLVLLSRMFHHERNTWIDRHKQINELVSNGISEKDIAKRLGCTESDIMHYLIHPDIPEEIVRLAFERKRSFPNIEDIRKLELHKFVKDRLYTALVDGQLSGDKLQKLKWLLSISLFKFLNWKEQWECIQEFVIHYKEYLLSKWTQQLEDRLNVFTQAN
ncbi:hypothetical protein DFQ01_109138 [Paenibacillus cellulosilyticus]|uniref:ParB-like nuclease family protein n=1 Tax=Paenibacillus cellulosilyticus TaxID=375489 RepID=A0A2V2YT08_9BACL|nr:hypothetical protein [Paenibacillus cellulosilyticus]PWW02513.1 hypothetical protein DFQ01_109138 [Paenibacillus cellulosilyticus]QKS47212.1 hypothetical protein HUB94_22495 [Paenibacillus cellulosilyticus]